ncbi:(2Fe-2S)-binding protein [Belliella marina]|uniref:(2Fe-2S)-binding protein n=1 Tax=Belliella marina TaxID=1644146 RepID=A0ABW4VQI2_9BACT
MKSIAFEVNGEKKTVEVDPGEPLLYILRDEFQLSGAKFGCGLQQCGSCMVLVDGENLPTCLSPCESFEGKSIETIEGLKSGNKLNAVQQAFVAMQAAQCGYCLNGMVITATSLLRKNKNPTEIEIKEALDQVICRCGTHSRFIKAVKIASESK